MRKINIILILLLSALLSLSAYMIWKDISIQQKEKKEFEELLEIIEMPEETTDPASTGMGTESALNDMTEPEVTEPEVQTRNLAPLFEKNSECIGWIYIEGTNVNYPVMHTPHNPQKYLRKNFDGEYSQSGVPFLDARCSADGGTAIIYGHNMKNGTQFSDLKKYLDTDFRNTHLTIEFQTEAGIHYYTVVDVIRTDIYDEIYNNISSEDNTLILSTCYGSAKSGRLLIIAKEATG